MRSTERITMFPMRNYHLYPTPLYSDLTYTRTSLRTSPLSEDYDARSRFTSAHDETNSHFGSESYAPSRNMFQNTDKRGLKENLKEALAGQIQDGEAKEV